MPSPLARAPPPRNISPRLSDNNGLKPLLSLHNFTSHRSVAGMMTHALSALAIALAVLVAAPAQAQCFADYKAKQDNPLRLHYGVIELPDSACGSTNAAAGEISRRIARDGWTLLNVMGIFGQDGLVGRRASAGPYFLRY